MHRLYLESVVEIRTRKRNDSAELTTNFHRLRSALTRKDLGPLGGEIPPSQETDGQATGSSSQEPTRQTLTNLLKPLASPQVRLA